MCDINYEITKICCDRHLKQMIELILPILKCQESECLELCLYGLSKFCHKHKCAKSDCVESTLNNHTHLDNKSLDSYNMSRC